MAKEKPASWLDKFIGLGIVVVELLGAVFGKPATAEDIAQEQLSASTEMPEESREEQELRNLPPHFPQKPGWSDAKPDSLPAPTYTPAIMAFGITFLALGLITKWYVSLVGLIVFAISAWRWFGELRDES